MHDCASTNSLILQVHICTCTYTCKTYNIHTCTHMHLYMYMYIPHSGGLYSANFHHQISLLHSAFVCNLQKFLVIPAKWLRPL